MRSPACPAVALSSASASSSTARRSPMSLSVVAALAMMPALLEWPGKSDTRSLARRARVGRLTPKDLQKFLELEPHLLHDLLALAHIAPGLFTRELVARTADREALIVQEAPNL